MIGYPQLRIRYGSRKIHHRNHHRIRYHQTQRYQKSSEEALSMDDTLNRQKKK